jgi:L-alanine-DL-glutamate epimerase-like enolase superfamily enzyme
MVRLTEGKWTGRGEGAAVAYRGETIDSMLQQLSAVRGELSRGITRRELQELLAPGGARNAVDCALWDLEAKRAGQRAWELAGMESVSPLKTHYTLSLDTPEAMGRAAAAARRYSMLKLKLDGKNDWERVKAVRAARPDAQIIVDANQSWSEQNLREFVPKFADAGVRLIEQPLPVGRDEPLEEFASLMPLCADESCQTTTSLPSLLRRYDYINIKLDKTGGLTEALDLAREAQAKGFKLMVGCMGGSSLSMAPAFVLGQLCDLADLDGPLFAAADVAHPMRYAGDMICAPDAELWG